MLDLLIVGVIKGVPWAVILWSVGKVWQATDNRKMDGSRFVHSDNNLCYLVYSLLLYFVQFWGICDCLSGRRRGILLPWLLSIKSTLFRTKYHGCLYYVYQNKIVESRISMLLLNQVLYVQLERKLLVICDVQSLVADFCVHGELASRSPAYFREKKKVCSKWTIFVNQSSICVTIFVIRLAHTHAPTRSFQQLEHS